jgi:hypothetical protein
MSWVFQWPGRGSVKKEKVLDKGFIAKVKRERHKGQKLASIS